MNEITNILKVIGNYKAEIVMIVLIYCGVKFLPQRNLLSVIIYITTVILCYQLYKSIITKTKPELKTWVLTIVRVPIVITIFYFLVRWLGGFGVAGLIITVVLLVVWKIRNQLKLYNNYTVWAARRLRGLTDEPFDIEKLKGDK